MTWFGVFCCAFCIDALWVRYMSATQAKTRWLAAFWAASIYLLGMSATKLCVDNPQLIFAGVAGAFLGTASAVES